MEFATLPNLIKVDYIVIQRIITMDIRGQEIDSRNFIHKEKSQLL